MREGGSEGKREREGERVKDREREREREVYTTGQVLSCFVAYGVFQSDLDYMCY